MMEKNGLNLDEKASQKSLTSEQEMIRKSQVKKAIQLSKRLERAQEDIDILECDSQGEQSLDGKSTKSPALKLKLKTLRKA